MVRDAAKVASIGAAFDDLEGHLKVISV